MPVTVGAEIRRIQQEEFAKVAYTVMSHAFAVHTEVGRLFREQIYQRLLVSRVPNSQVEVPITISHQDFEKTLLIDLLVDGGAAFELKTCRSIRPVHQAQLLNYLLLSDLAHGKLINFRPESVQHEFVNTTLVRADRLRFQVRSEGWIEPAELRVPLMPSMVELLRDWGTCLSVSLYTQAITHFLGGPCPSHRNLVTRSQSGNAKSPTCRARCGIQNHGLRGAGQRFRKTCPPFSPALPVGSNPVG